MFRGCSRTLKTPNSPPLAVVTFTLKAHLYAPWKTNDLPPLDVCLQFPDILICVETQLRTFQCVSVILHVMSLRPF